MVPNLFQLPCGDSVSLVARVQRTSSGGLSECIGVSPEQGFLLKSSMVLTPGIYTLYGLILDSKTPMILGTTEATTVFPKRGFDPSQKMSIFDVCSGMVASPWDQHH